ncbi:MAG: FG-GAP-like repeat-containing protein [Bacteroidota bacterium]
MISGERGNSDSSSPPDELTFFYFQNDGNNNFTQLTGSGNFFNGLREVIDSSPQLVDLDGDGDLDLISGEAYGRLFYFQNDGSNNFTELTGTSNPFNVLDVGRFSTPQLVDLDDDGDLDLISGEAQGTFFYYTNDGNDNFTQVTGTANPFDSFDVGGRSCPRLVDVDGDGDLDLISGESLGTFFYFQNDGSDNFAPIIGIANPFDGLDIGSVSTPQLVDLDNDGDLDLISGESFGTFFYIQNQPTCLLPKVDGYVNCGDDAFDGLDVGRFSTPQLVDADGDGDLDLISGEGNGTFIYFQNDGNNNFAQITGTANPFDGFDVGYDSTPQLVDLDGDLDLISGEFYGSILYYKTDDSGNYVQLTGAANPFDGIIVEEFHSAPQLIDVDSDGDLDLISGDDYGAFLYFQNDGSNNFIQITGTNNPFDSFNVGSLSSPQLIDFDFDGDLDLISGGQDGRFTYFQNDGNNNFVQLTGTTNPFDGVDLGLRSKPQFIDVDMDGDLDLISGEFYGTFVYFQNTNLAVSASTAACISNEGEVELTVTSTQEEGTYTISNAFSGSIGIEGQMNAMEVLNTSIK